MEQHNPLNDKGLDAKALEAKFVSAHPMFTIEQWRDGPSESSDTNGYWDWVASMVELYTTPDDFKPTPEGGDTDADSTLIETLDGMANVVMNWHHSVQAQLRHLVQIPEGAVAEYETDEKPGETEGIPLVGDALKAFKIGLLTAISIIDTLPFKANVVEEEDKSDATPPAENAADYLAGL